MAGNIYIFTNLYKPYLGGIQTVTSQFAETLHCRNESVVVITTLGRKACMPYSRINGVPVFRLLFKNNISFIILFILFFINRPNCVYVHFPQEQAKYVCKLKKYFSFHLASCFHGHDVLMYSEGYSKDNDLYKNKKELVKLSDRITACSKYLATEVEMCFDCQNQVVPIYNGVDLSRYSVKIDRPVRCAGQYMFAFGRLEIVKGFDILIEAISKLTNYPDLSLLIAGDGTQKDKLQAQITNLHLEDRVQLIGRALPEEIVAYCQNAECIIIPSLREPFGIVVLEAIASKRPIVATNAGGIPEVMDERFGCLVDPTVDGLKDGIECILQGRDVDFSEADQYLKFFSIENMVDNYLGVLTR